METLSTSQHHGRALFEPGSCIPETPTRAVEGGPVAIDRPSRRPLSAVLDVLSHPGAMVVLTLARWLLELLVS